MKNIFALTLILALGTPAAAELAAPELPSIDAAVVRSQPFEKESIKISAAKLSAKRDISGTYSIKNGYAEGSVTIRQFPANNTEYAAFILSTVAGPNAHTTDISGVALQTQSGDFAFRDENNCTLRLKVANGVLTVTGANASCVGYTGVNAVADGEYRKTAGYMPARLDGHYTIETAYTQGDLEVREFQPAPGSSLPSLGFALFTVSGPNAHTAYINGIAVRTTTPGQFAFVGEDGCELRLKPENGSIRVSDNGACAAYMGMNAAVAGKYSRTK
jgi:hypothetical protein